MRPIEIKNVKITNWKNGKTILLRKLSDATKILGWSQNDLIHFYPVLRGERFTNGDYCLHQDLKNKTYKIYSPIHKKVICLKNWVKFAKTYGMHPLKLKKLLDEEFIFYKGFYYLKNKDKIPKNKIIWLKKDGIDYECWNAREFSEKYKIKAHAIFDLARGKIGETKCGWKLSEINYF
jgi:hypothetical protein